MLDKNIKFYIVRQTKTHARLSPFSFSILLVFLLVIFSAFFEKTGNLYLKKIYITSTFLSFRKSVTELK